MDDIYEVKKVGHGKYELVYNTNRFTISLRYERCSCGKRDCFHKDLVYKYIVEKNQDKAGVSVIDPPEENYFD
jgi:hypothetical protein